MAAGNVNDLTNCPVCSEPYTTTGENVPKILPCTHSLCAKCTTKKPWRRQSYLKCPQCGELCIFKGVEFIWDNTHILAHLKSKSNHQQEVKLHCQEHGREIILYCDSCHICLCFLCARTKHQECDIFGIREEKLTEILFEKVSCLRKTLEDDKKMSLKTNHFIDQKTETCIEQIKLEKEQKLNEITLVFGELIKSVLQKNVQVKADTDKSLAEINANIEKTRNLERNRDSTLPITLLLAMKDIQRLPRRHTGNYYEYVKNSGNLQSVCGQLEQRELRLDGDQELQESNSHVGDKDLQESNSYVGDKDLQENNPHVGDKDMQENNSYVSDQDSFLAGDQDVTESSSPADDQNMQEKSFFESDQNSSLASDQELERLLQYDQFNSLASNQYKDENSSDADEYYLCHAYVSKQNKMIEVNSNAGVSNKVTGGSRDNKGLFDTRIQGGPQNASTPKKNNKTKMQDGNRRSDVDQFDTDRDAPDEASDGSQSETESGVVRRPELQNEENDEPGAGLGKLGSERGDKDGNDSEPGFSIAKRPRWQPGRNKCCEGVRTRI